MFRRKRNEGEEDRPEGEAAPESFVAPAAKAASRPAAPPPNLPNRVPTMPPRQGAADLGRPPELPRRPSELGMPAARPARIEAETRQLIVGREISLTGEIKACDRLVVEGSVEANLANCRDIDIAESGLFKGSASIDEAEIRGRFEGTLTVRNRLFIRATGRVTGTVRYGQIEIECGGQISGEVQNHSPDAVALEPRRERASQGVVELGVSRVE